jgi:hypothetical protein
MVLSTYLIACLVTQAEHRALGKANAADGWDRYRVAGVVVPGMPELPPGHF